MSQQEPSARSEQEKRIFTTIMVASTRLQTLFDKTIPDLTLKQFMLLAIARASPVHLTLHEIGERLGCSRQNVRQLTTSLCEKGLVRLAPSDRVARALCVQLTDAVSESFAQTLESYIRDLDYLFEAYSPEELSTLCTLLERLPAGIDDLERQAPELKNSSS
ncbi:MAG: MarR family transcriptional regulator [Clostridia bacterium]|nr:MarR family transcriptional regulator [Clostridia bacterium]